jgi:microcystin-dependent protein
MPVYRWSETAATNATADPTCVFPEGQAASSLNDGARGLMAAVKMYVDDISGATVTAGTSTSYTVASYSGFTSLAYLDKQMIAFTPHTTNGAGPVTLSVDSLTAKPLRPIPGFELNAGTIIQGTPYVAVYNNSDGVFYLQGFYGNPYIVPLGAGMPYFGTTTPNSSFAFPGGQAISRTTYATLFSLIGTTYGSGDGSATFTLPDATGRLLAMKEATATRLTTAGGGVDGGTLGATGGQQSRTLLTANLPPYTPAGSITNGGITVNGSWATGGSTNNNGGGGGGSFGAFTTFTGATASQAGSTFAGTVQGGTSTAVQTLPPLLVANFIMRII